MSPQSTESRALTAQATHAFTVNAPDGYPFDLRTYGNDDGSRVIVSHGNGLAVDAFAPFWRILAKTCQVVTFDMRGHGRNPPPSPVENNWRTFVADLGHIFEGIRRELGERRTFGAFHSLSSFATLLHTAESGEPWDGLVLYEPPVHPPVGEQLTEEYLALHRRLSAQAAARRDHFETPEDLTKRFRRSPLFAAMPEESIQLLARATLRLDPEGAGFTLACPRWFESKTFDVSVLAGTYASLTHIEAPTTIVVATPEAPGQQKSLLARLGQRLSRDAGFGLREIPGATHFMQLEKPELAAAIALDIIHGAQHAAGTGRQPDSSRI